MIALFYRGVYTGNQKGGGTMKIDNIKPAPAEEDHKVEIQGKKNPRERKLKKQLKKVKIVCKKAKHDAKRALRAQHNAERERDTVAAENALLHKRLESKDEDVTNALRDEDGFIRLKERNGKND